MKLAPYEAYDNNNPYQTNFYVINSSREVFLCIQQGKNADGSAKNSFVEPTSTLASQEAKTFETGDGYLWRYMYKMSNLALWYIQNKNLYTSKTSHQSSNDDTRRDYTDWAFKTVQRLGRFSTSRSITGV